MNYRLLLTGLTAMSVVAAAGEDDKKIEGSKAAVVVKLPVDGDKPDAGKAEPEAAKTNEPTKIGNGPFWFDLVQKSDGMIEGKVINIAFEGVEGMIADAGIAFIQNGKVIAKSKTDSDGMFSIAGVEPGLYSFVASNKNGMAAFRVRVVPATASLKKVTTEKGSLKTVSFSKQDVVIDNSLPVTMVPATDLPIACNTFAQTGQACSQACGSCGAGCAAGQQPAPGAGGLAAGGTGSTYGGGFGGGFGGGGAGLGGGLGLGGLGLLPAIIPALNDGGSNSGGIIPQPASPIIP